MSTGTSILLALQGLIFAVWAFLLFRTIFLLAHRARQKTGQAFSGPFATLSQWRNWLTCNEDRTARRRLGIITVALFCMSAINAALSSA